MKPRTWLRLSFVIVGCGAGIHLTGAVISVHQGRTLPACLSVVSLATSSVILAVLCKIAQWHERDEREHEERMTFIREMHEAVEQITKGVDHGRADDPG